MKLQVEKERGQMVGRGGGGTDRRDKVQERDKKSEEWRRKSSEDRSYCPLAVSVLTLFGQHWVPVKLGAELERVNLYIKSKIIYLIFILQVRNLRL